MGNFQKLTLVPLFIFISITSFPAIAQKLPGKQELSVYAPNNIKIDGKATEWGNKFQAYNHATDIFYTISNDGTNLYLTVQATEQNVINKIMSGGLTLTIQKSEKKSDKGGISITYPVFERKSRPYFNKADLEKGASATNTLTDSAVMARNKSFSERSKLIGVTGIPAMDTLISVYNEDGIKAAAMFDNKGAFTYELAVNQKLLGISATGIEKFAYHITLNGTSMFNPVADKIISISSIGGGGQMGGAGMDNIKISTDLGTSPTDFWGEYILAKK
jgi:hypothetical protein